MMTSLYFERDWGKRKLNELQRHNWGKRKLNELQRHNRGKRKLNELQRHNRGKRKLNELQRQKIDYETPEPGQRVGRAPTC